MDSKNIKDYLHLYIGCEMQFSRHREPQNEKYKYILTLDNISEAFDFRDIPILRPLSDMTEDEDQIEFPKNNRGEFIDMHWYPSGYMWLLSKGFDLFGLIESGLAIKKSN